MKDNILLISEKENKNFTNAQRQVSTDFYCKLIEHDNLIY